MFDGASITCSSLSPPPAPCRRVRLLLSRCPRPRPGRRVPDAGRPVRRAGHRACEAARAVGVQTVTQIDLPCRQHHFQSIASQMAGKNRTYRHCAGRGRAPVVADSAELLAESCSDLGRPATPASTARRRGGGSTRLFYTSVAPGREDPDDPESLPLQGAYATLTRRGSADAYAAPRCWPPGSPPSGARPAETPRLLPPTPSDHLGRAVLGRSGEPQGQFCSRSGRTARPGVAPAEAATTEGRAPQARLEVSQQPSHPGTGVGG